MWILLFGSSTILGPVRGGEGPLNRVGRPDRWTPFHKLLVHLFILLLKSKNLIPILPLSLLILSLHLSHLFLRDIKSAICSILDIFSFTMLLVDTIYFLLHANSLGPTVGANCSRMRLEPREQFGLLLSRSIGLQFFPSSQNELLPFPSSLCLSVSVNFKLGWYLQKALRRLS